MLYVYRRVSSLGARDLADAVMLQGTMCRRTRGKLLRDAVAGDHVVCWGSNFAAVAGTLTLNNVPHISKFTEAQRLREKNIPTIEVSRTKPRDVIAVAAVKPPFVPNRFNVAAGNYDVLEAQGFVVRVSDFIRVETQRRVEYNLQPAPLPVLVETWLARKNNHVGGNDLLADNLDNPHFYSKKLDLVEEYRLHMFNGKSIRAGKKVQRTTRPDGRTAPHQWIRSYDAGWVIDYAGFESTKPMRELAAKALKALDLDFGAVDIGKKADGTLVVLEANRAPGVEGGTVESYARHIINWSRGVVAGQGE